MIFGLDELIIILLVYNGIFVRNVWRVVMNVDLEVFIYKVDCLKVVN